MRRHQTLIPISREHHQILMLAQLLKTDAPPYRGLPDTLNEKLVYASHQYTRFIKSHLTKDELILYPFFSEFQSLEPILEKLQSVMEEIKFSFEKAEIIDQEKSNALGVRLEKYVRMKERELFEEAQKHLSEDDFAILSARLNS